MTLKTKLLVGLGGLVVTAAAVFFGLLQYYHVPAEQLALFGNDLAAARARASESGRPLLVKIGSNY